MLSRHKLYLRITIFLALMISASSIVFVVILHKLNNDLERALLDTLVAHELEEIVISYNEGERIVLPNLSILKAYLGSRKNEVPIPEFLSRLPPDIHQDVKHEGRTYHVAIADMVEDRVYIAFDTSSIEEHDRQFGIVLIAAGITAPMLVLIIAVRYISRVVKPVSAIANELLGMDPDQRGGRLSGNYKGYEVSQIEGAINQYLSRLDGFVEREQFFAAAASHEMRTPITVIRTSVELAGNPQLSQHQVKNYLERIGRSANYMEELIEGLLFLVREPGTGLGQELEVVSVYEVVRSEVEILQQSGNVNRVEINFSRTQDLKITGEWAHLSIVIGNLLKNSLAHSHDGAINVGLSNKTLSISDTGDGIASDYLERVFERGFHSQKNGSHGLGLYISKKICDRYGWNLRLTSSENVGTRAEIQF